MKTMTFTIEESVAEKLKSEKNKSALISNLLKEHYNIKDFKRLSREELEVMIKREEAKKKYEKKLQELQ